MLKKVLLTGASGFLGNIISSELAGSYELISLSRRRMSDITCDLSTTIPEVSKVDFVIHAAGKAHLLPNSKREEDEFNTVNFQGIVNVSKALEISGLPSSFIFISSVSVYGLEQGENISEDFPLKGISPYAKSKIDAEKFIIDWGIRNGVKVCVLRLPLIVGPNPLGNLKAIIKAIKFGYYFRINEGSAQKSMVWGEDVAKILPKCFTISGIFNLTDGIDSTIKDFDLSIANSFNKSIKVLPHWLVKIIAVPSKIISFWPINDDRITKLLTSLTFSSEKAIKELGWKPRSVIDCIDKYGI